MIHKRRYKVADINAEFNTYFALDNSKEYFLFKTSGSEGKQKNVFIETGVFFSNFKKYLSFFNIQSGADIILTSKVSDNHPYAFGIVSTFSDTNHSDDIKELIGLINSGKKYIFSTPSFFINFKDFMKLDRSQVIVLTGEDVPSALRKWFNNNKLTVYQSFGMSEALNIGIKDLNNDEYTFIDTHIKIDDGMLYSPYLCSYIISESSVTEVYRSYRLGDSIESHGKTFKFLERDANIAKINENKVSLKEIENFLLTLKEIKDCAIIKNKVKDLDELQLFHVSDLSQKQIEDLIIKHFNSVNHVPKKIIKLESIPLTEMGKKDISFLRTNYAN
jgi:acyl-coenzyme A synthetase/AMP-(fatty) acid ligase